MEEASIYFHEEDIVFQLPDETAVINWITNAISDYKKEAGDISFIFTSDKELHKINVKHLDHDNLTDVITFDYCEDNLISGDIYISIERVKENATKFSQSLDNEILRILIHSVLHLLGYKDKTVEDKTEMTQKEDFYLSLLPPISA
ncbi:MAG: rRNA maturation RNase YbeY [Flavobacteriales bacterium]|nr:rRNA maturation RNase YbeY [Flavobacteriales bacterium]